jgi:WD40 repeat protein
LLPNPFELYDMIGNVQELCEDGCFDDRYQTYSTSVAIDPMASWVDKPLRILRGGDYKFEVLGCRSAYRNRGFPTTGYNLQGFRVALPVDAVRQRLQLSGQESVLPVPAEAKVAVDLTPPAPLGTWEMGPEPPWFGPKWWGEPNPIQTSAALPGLIERPARLPGIKRWNVDTAWPRGSVIVARYSPDSRWLAIGAHDGHVRIYAADSMELVCLLPGRSGEHGVLDLSWHPDSERLAVSADGNGDGQALRIWSRTGALLFEETTPSYGSVAWSHSGDWLAEGSTHRVAIRRADGTVDRVLVKGSTLGVYRGGSMAWSPDDASIACRHYSGDVRVWNVASGESVLLAENSKPGFGGGFGLEWSRAGWLAVVEPKQLRLFHPASQASRTIAFDSTRSVAWFPDGLRGVLNSGYSHASLWNVEEGQEPLPMSVEWDANQALAVSPDGQRVALARQAVHIYGADLKERLFQSPRSANNTENVIWSRDGQRLATCIAESGTLLEWSVEGRRTAAVPLGAINCRVQSGPDGQYLLCGGSRPGLWLVAPSQSPRQIVTTFCTSADWSADGRYIAAGSLAGVVMILNARGEIVAEMPAGEGAAEVAWSPGSHRLAVHCGRQIFVCDPQAGWKLIPGATTELTPDQERPPIWAPDGQRFSCRSLGWFDPQGQRIADQHPQYPLAWRPDGQRLLDAWFACFMPGGSLAARREFNGYNYGPRSLPQYHPRGHLVAANYVQGALVACRETDVQPYWHIVLLPGDQSATFSAAGELLDGKPEEIDQYLAYFIDRGNGRIETLTPAEFRKLQPASRAPMN